MNSSRCPLFTWTARGCPRVSIEGPVICRCAILFWAIFSSLERSDATSCGSTALVWAGLRSFTTLLVCSLAILTCLTLLFYFALFWSVLTCSWSLGFCKAPPLLEGTWSVFATQLLHKLPPLIMNSIAKLAGVCVFLTRLECCLFGVGPRAITCYIDTWAI